MSRLKTPDARVRIEARGTAAFAPTIGESASSLLRHLSQRGVVPASDSDRVLRESVAILANCVAPPSPARRRAGLVCGYVQSGKTVSIQTVSALAQDNGFRLVILMAGVTTILVDQSRDRVDDELRAATGEYSWLMLKNPRESDREHLRGLVQEWRRKPSTSPGSKVLFITVMKNKSHLQRLARILRGLDLSNIPAIVFDDEGDQASLNTRPLDPRPSTIYTCIEELRAALPHHTLLQYTATPQAPLLISRIDSLSADFADLVDAGAGYCGGRAFFGLRMDKLVEKIPPDEIFPHDALPESPPTSLMAALRSFYLGVASSYALGQNKTGHRSMLVHPHQRKEVHRAYLQWVEALKHAWCDALIAEEEDLEDLLVQFQESYRDLSATVSNLPAFNDLRPHLADAIGQTIVTLVNSNNGREIQWRNGYAHILVGGEKLGRGYTVKGLTVTYMPRGPGGWTADTIQQRARFFGYHDKEGRSYFDYCRVHLHPDVLEAYTSYVEHEEDVRRQIAQFRGRPLRELKRAFLLNAPLKPTRHNVLSEMYVRPDRQKGWFEQRAPHVAAAQGSTNRSLADELFRKLRPRHREYERHSYADAALSEVLEGFLSVFACPDDRDATPIFGMIQSIRAALRDEPNLTCRVYFMDVDRPCRERSLGKDDDEIDLQQGRTSARRDGGYPGDNVFFVEDRVTVQIHRLRIVRGKRVINSDAPALAIRLPGSVSDKMRGWIVQRSN